MGDLGMQAIPVPVRERILQLYEDGDSTAEIAELLGYCVAAVRRVRQHFRARGADSTDCEQRGRLWLRPAVCAGWFHAILR